PPMIGLVDPQTLAELNARYEPRFAALWAAVQAAILSPPAVAASEGEAARLGAVAASAGKTARLPTIASAPPGDRRFAAREWTDLPYFSLLKQSYLLASEYANELAA